MRYKLYFIVLFAGLLGNNFAHAQSNIQSVELNDLRTIEERYPEVFSITKPNHPDTAYEIGKKIQGFELDFSGNEGKNQFYLIYAQHLQKLNNNTFTNQYRHTFLQLYQAINRVNELIDTNVTYYTNMQSQLIAYAEYSLYEFSRMDSSKFETIDVPKQRKFFIKSIQVKVKTKNQQLNLNTLPNYNKNQELIAAEIKKIENLITDGYTLKVSQVFHYKYY